MLLGCFLALFGFTIEHLNLRCVSFFSLVI